MPRCGPALRRARRLRPAGVPCRIGTAAFHGALVASLQLLARARRGPAGGSGGARLPAARDDRRPMPAPATMRAGPWRRLSGGPAGERRWCRRAAGHAAAAWTRLSTISRRCRPGRRVRLGDRVSFDFGLYQELSTTPAGLRGLRARCGSPGRRGRTLRRSHGALRLGDPRGRLRIGLDRLHEALEEAGASPAGGAAASLRRRPRGSGTAAELRQAGIAVAALPAGGKPPAPPRCEAARGSTTSNWPTGGGARLLARGAARPGGVVSLRVALTRGALPGARPAAAAGLPVEPPYGKGQPLPLCTLEDGTTVCRAAADVPLYVESGAADVGVAGKEWLLEQGRDVYELLDLRLAPGRLMFAAGRGAEERAAASAACAWPPRTRDHAALLRACGRQVRSLPAGSRVRPRPVWPTASYLVPAGRTLRAAAWWSARSWPFAACGLSSAAPPASARADRRADHAPASWRTRHVIATEHGRRPTADGRRAARLRPARGRGARRGGPDRGRRARARRRRRARAQPAPRQGRALPLTTACRRRSWRRPGRHAAGAARRALELAAANIRAYHEREAPQPLARDAGQGQVVGQEVVPLARRRPLRARRPGQLPVVGADDGDTGAGGRRASGSSSARRRGRRRRGHRRWPPPARCSASPRLPRRRRPGGGRHGLRHGRCRAATSSSVPATRTSPRPSAR